MQQRPSTRDSSFKEAMINYPGNQKTMQEMEEVGGGRPHTRGARSGGRPTTSGLMTQHQMQNFQRLQDSFHGAAGGANGLGAIEVSLEGDSNVNALVQKRPSTRGNPILQQSNGLYESQGQKDRASPLPVNNFHFLIIIGFWRSKVSTIGILFV